MGKNKTESVLKHSGSPETSQSASFERLWLNFPVLLNHIMDWLRK